MKYICIKCNYFYDESIGNENDNIKAATKIENIYFCPNCEEEDSFIAFKPEVNYIDEKANDFLEKQHFIKYRKNGNDLEISVGDKLHPMERSHRISWVGILDEYGDLIDEEFLSEDEDSFIEFKNFDEEIFEIRINCSKHGLWGKKINF